MDVDPYMTRKEFQSAVEPLVERVRLRLQDLGYCPTNEQTISFRMMALIPIVLLLFVGILKVQAGGERHHPIAILLFFVSITALGIIPLAARPFRTRAGGEVVKSYQEEYARLARAPLDDELIIAVALAGPVVLVGTPYASVYAASQTTKGGSDGGGCGGGGGGGGGCGGCGGGD